jgi:hypothetical protein
MSDRRAFLKLGASLGALLGGGPLAALAAPDPARVALVIGNNAYPRAPLNNAVNDARAIALVLEQAGFQVDLRIDATRVALLQAVDAFGKAIARSEVKLGFFYYAGHGAQVDWRNYLLPVDASVASAADLPAQCLDLAVLLDRLGKTREKVFVVVLDACRDNPFGGAFRPEQQGLSQFDAPVGTVLAFATAPGSVASDGGGAHGLYSQNLVRELAVRGARIEDVFKRVRLNVRLSSQGEQIPWESTSLESDVYLFPEQKKLSEAELEKQFEQELAAWNRIKNSRKADDWAGYLREYPHGKFTEIAQSRLNVLLAEIERKRSPAAPAVAGTPAQFFELGAGLPVPDFYGPARNPNSAGTYPLDRRYTVGDQVAFVFLDPISKVRQQLVSLTITSIDPDGDRVVYNNGVSISDLMGNPLKQGAIGYDVPVQVFPAEVQVGKRWESRFRRTEADGRVGNADAEMTVKGRETIRVPAGTFDTFFIYGRGYNRSFGAEFENRIWIVPGLNFSVATELISRKGGNVLFAERRELVSAKQHYIPFARV